MKILAATDVLADGAPVLDFAATLAQQTGGKMYLLHALAPTMINTYGTFCNGVYDDPLMGPLEGTPPVQGKGTNHLLAAADMKAKQLASEISAKYNIPIYGKAEEAEDIGACVNDFCKRHSIDLLASGNRHHTLLTSILLGNTAEKLVRAATIPVTVVPCGPKASGAV